MGRVFGGKDFQTAANEFRSIAEERKSTGRNRNRRTFDRHFQSWKEFRFVKQQHLAGHRISETRFQQDTKSSVLSCLGANVANGGVIRTADSLIVGGGLHLASHNSGLVGWL